MIANIPKLLEGAFSAMIVQTAELAELPRIRTWEAIDADGRWSPLNDRNIPLIDIRVPFPGPDENAHTESVFVPIKYFTDSATDQTHQQISTIAAAVQSVLDKLYSDFQMGRQPGPERTAFENYISDQQSGCDVKITVSGFSKQENLPEPYTEGGANVKMSGIRVHYSRSDL